VGRRGCERGGIGAGVDGGGWENLEGREVVVVDFRV